MAGHISPVAVAKAIVQLALELPGLQAMGREAANEKVWTALSEWLGPQQMAEALAESSAAKAPVRPQEPSQATGRAQARESHLHGSWTKLRSGNWGARLSVEDGTPVAEGVLVTLYRKGGKDPTVRVVDQVVARFKDNEAEGHFIVLAEVRDV